MKTQGHSNRRTLTVTDPRSLNTRTTAAFVKKAMQFKSDIIVSSQTTTCNGKSFMSLLYLVTRLGTTLTIHATGDDAQEALESLEQFLLSHLSSQTHPCPTNNIVPA